MRVHNEGVGMDHPDTTTTGEFDLVSQRLGALPVVNRFLTGLRPSPTSRAVVAEF